MTCRTTHARARPRTPSVETAAGRAPPRRVRAAMEEGSAGPRAGPHPKVGAAPRPAPPGAVSVTVPEGAAGVAESGEVWEAARVVPAVVVSKARAWAFRTGRPRPRSPGRRHAAVSPLPGVSPASAGPSAPTTSSDSVRWAGAVQGARPRRAPEEALPAAVVPAALPAAVVPAVAATGPTRPREGCLVRAPALRVSGRRAGGNVVRRTWARRPRVGVRRGRHAPARAAGGPRPLPRGREDALRSAGSGRRRTGARRPGRATRPVPAPSSARPVPRGRGSPVEVPVDRRVVGVRP